jgi:hypothetical protein
MHLFDFIALSLVTILGVCCWYFRIPHKYVIASGLFLLVSAAGAALGGLAETASEASVAAFFVLAAGIILGGVTRLSGRSFGGQLDAFAESSAGEDKQKTH